MSSNTTPAKVWFITGVAADSLGHYISLSALSRNDLVIGTSRSPQATISPLLLNHPGFSALQLDLFAEEKSLSETIDKAVSIHGYIDYVIHTAGGVLVGATEETTTAQLRDHFHLNVFSHVALTQMLLPHLRNRGKEAGSVICFFGSIAGWPPAEGSDGWGGYCASKSALAAIAKALRKEVKEDGITVTLCEPGYFRTPILNNKNNTGSGQSSGRGIVYGALKGSVEALNGRLKGFYDTLEKVDGNQPGDPKKGGEKIVQALKMEGEQWAGWKKDGIPVRWGLGDDAVPWIEGVLNEETENIKRWKGLTDGVSH